MVPWVEIESAKGSELAKSTGGEESAAIELPTTRSEPFDPPPELAELRGKGPACPLRYPDGHLGWVVTGYQPARAVLTDTRFSTRPRRLAVGDPVKFAAVHGAKDADPAASSGDLLFLSPQEHTRMRHILAGHFTVSRVAEHRQQIEQFVDDRLDSMENLGPPADLVKDFAMAVAGSTHCELLGLEPSESDRFVRPAAIVIDPDRTLEEQMTAWEELSSFVRGVARTKAERPGNDLISDLVRGGELSDDEIVGCSIALFTAGVDVTASMIALGALVLLCNREQMDKLRADPTIIESAVEELLRYISIFQIGAFPRTALEDVDLEGMAIRTGESVTVSIAAANRDPSKFDDADLLDLTRLTRGHLAFGYGRHMCLGQHLARLELQIALLGLVSRFPTLALAVPFEDLDLYGGDHIAYGVRKLPVAWRHRT